MSDITILFLILFVWLVGCCLSAYYLGRWGDYDSYREDVVISLFWPIMGPTLLLFEVLIFFARKGRKKYRRR